MTIVEASFALPILILFIAGLIDLGLWTFESNKASNAARDGARAGIIVHLDADDVVGDDRTAVVEAVEAHLPGRTLSPTDITITCVDPDGDPVVGGCAAARLDVDRIRVDVRWDHELITPLAPLLGLDDVEARGQATMVIVGRALPGSGTPSTTTTTSTPGPTTTTTPGPTTTTTTTTTPGCSLTDLDVSPDPNSAKNSGALQNNVDISFSVGAGSTCSTLVVQVEAPDGSAVSHTCGCGAGTNRSWTYGKNSDNFWTAGEATVRVFNGASVVASADFTVN